MPVYAELCPRGVIGILPPLKINENPYNACRQKVKFIIWEDESGNCPKNILPFCRG